MMPITQIGVLALLILHTLQFVAYPGAMNLRTSVAVSVFLLTATFAARCGSTSYSIISLQLFGLLGAFVIMIVLHFNAT
jgi:hypothetical protein